jgi:hypothetical protein
MHQIVTLRNLPCGVDDAVARALCKIPREDTPPESWPDTEVGGLVKRMNH